MNFPAEMSLESVEKPSFSCICLHNYSKCRLFVSLKYRYQKKNTKKEKSWNTDLNEGLYDSQWMQRGNKELKHLGENNEARNNTI